jgi:hypothetical protein
MFGLGQKLVHQCPTQIADKIFIRHLYNVVYPGEVLLVCRVGERVRNDSG